RRSVYVRWRLGSEVRDDEVVARDVFAGEVGQERRVGTHVSLAVRRVVGDVGEVHERVVVDVVPVAFTVVRAVAAVVRARAFVLLVRLPRDPGRVEHVGEVGSRGPLGRVGVVRDPEVRPGLEPQVVGQARVVVGRVVVLLCVRGDGQQRVDVRGRRAALDARPVGVLHHDEEHRTDGRRRQRGRGGGGRRPGRGRGGSRRPCRGRGGRPCRSRGGSRGRRPRGRRGGRWWPRAGGGRRRAHRRRDGQAVEPLRPAVPVDDDVVRLPRGHRRREAGGAIQT